MLLVQICGFLLLEHEGYGRLLDRYPKIEQMFEHLQLEKLHKVDDDSCSFWYGLIEQHHF
jgi:hypothetical protein